MSKLTNEPRSYVNDAVLCVAVELLQASQDMRDQISARISQHLFGKWVRRKNDFGYRRSVWRVTRVTISTLGTLNVWGHHVLRDGRLAEGESCAYDLRRLEIFDHQPD